MKRTIKRLINKFYKSDCNASEKICIRKRIIGNDFAWLQHVSLVAIMMLINFTGLNAQSITGTQWESANITGGPGYNNWGSGVVSLTDTTTNSGTCQAGAVHETGTTYNPTTGTTFNKCYKVFFGCPGNDQIGTVANPYTDLNGDGMAFSFWKSTGTYNINNGLACGGGLGYMGTVASPGTAGSMITIEFDTYSSMGGSGFDGCYGGGGAGAGINDEISVHKDGDASDVGLITACPNAGGTVNTGNLEDGLQHLVCITYTPGTRILSVSIDGVNKISYDLGATYNLSTYFGNVGLNQTWSAGKYGANNLQTVGAAGSNLFAAMGRNPCTGAVVTPVKLLTFTGEIINETVVLNWATAVEKNNKKFVIERSSDHSDWEAISEVAGAGNATSNINYSYTDYTSFDGIYYYRLKQVDIDGTIAFSNVVALETNASELSISPNPFEDAFTIKSNIRENMDISIHDVLGRLLYQVNKKNEKGTVCIHPDLSSGAYFVTIQSETFIQQKKIIKK